MFGMALRSYQKKMRRLTESAAVGERTLWQAVLDLVEREQPTRRRARTLRARRRTRGRRCLEGSRAERPRVRDGHRQPGAVRGDEPGARDKLSAESDLDSIANLAWLALFRREAETEAELVTLLGVEPERVAPRGRRAGRRRASEPQRRPARVEQPGAAGGGGAGLGARDPRSLRAVTVAIATKIQAGFGAAAASDKSGGSTFTFTVTPGHPHELEVYEP